MMKKQIEKNDVCTIHVAKGKLGDLVCLEIAGGTIWLNKNQAHLVASSLENGIAVLEQEE